PYHQLVGSLNYIACGTCPDISFAQQQLRKHLDTYRPDHWEAAKHDVQYLKGTHTLKLILGGTHVAQLLGFMDASYATCPDTLRSVGGYCFSLGSSMVTWSACSQKTVLLTSCEAEYITACSIVLSSDPSFHAHVKHVDIKYHYICKRMEAKEVTFQWVKGMKNTADTFTKALPPKTFQLLCDTMGLV
ncbi:hypothetical protein PAXRUDRAFT_91960, partial [Paxillus rubicundulus Ve08.2h10]